jgi:hypothetical protein
MDKGQTAKVSPIVLRGYACAELFSVLKKYIFRCLHLQHKAILIAEASMNLAAGIIL